MEMEDRERQRRRLVLMAVGTLAFCEPARLAMAEILSRTCPSRPGIGGMIRLSWAYAMIEAKLVISQNRDELEELARLLEARARGEHLRELDEFGGAALMMGDGHHGSRPRRARPDGTAGSTRRSDEVL